MFDFEVFDSSVLQGLNLQAWSGIDAFAEMLSESTASITTDGHLVLWSKCVSPALRSNAFDAFNAIRATAGEPELLLPGGFGLKVFYRDTLYWGNLLSWRHLRYLEPKSYSEDRDPEVFGNVEDQEPGYTTMTVVSNKRTLGSLLDKWKPRFLVEGGSAKSALFIARSGTAIQIRLLCDEVHLEDVIDVFVAGAFAVKDQRGSRMLVGLSYTEAVASPEKKEPYTGKLILPTYTYPSITKVEVRVEDKYGPFEKVRPEA